MLKLRNCNNKTFLPHLTTYILIPACNVTRFGEILPLRQNIEHTLANSLCYGAKFQWSNVEKVIKPSGHTACMP